MTSFEIEHRLDHACAQLAAAKEALLAMTSPTDAWCDPFRNAAHLLEGLDLSGMSQSRRREIQEGLSEIQMSSAAAGRLLESAAALHFGRVLSRSSSECGYLADGKALSIGGGCFRIDA